MQYEFLDLGTTVNNVARLTLRRASKKNALCMAMRDELEAALACLVQDKGVHAVVLAGGDGIFCAGFDLKEGAESGGKAFRHRFRQFFEACYLFPKPMVAAVDGPALAGGFDLALMADFIVASSRARFGHPEIDFGPVAVLPLARFVGPARLRELCLLGRPLDVETARADGIVHQIVEPGQTEAAATTLAEHLASKPPAAIAGTKQALNRRIVQDSIAADEAAIDSLLAGTNDAYDKYVAEKLS